MNQAAGGTGLRVRVRCGRWEGEGTVQCSGVGQTYHQGVLVIDDGDVHERPNPVRAAIDGYEIVTADVEAMELLWAAGYRIKGMRH